jgi:hypothetical protein
MKKTPHPVNESAARQALRQALETGTVQEFRIVREVYNVVIGGTETVISTYKGGKLKTTVK